jgi:hypothetical protein
VLHSLLIQPIQRMPRYLLLLEVSLFIIFHFHSYLFYLILFHEQKDLLKNTKEDHPDFNYLASAIEKVKKINLQMNESKRESESLQQVFLLSLTLKPSGKVSLIFFFSFGCVQVSYD